MVKVSEVYDALKSIVESFTPQSFPAGTRKLIEALVKRLREEVTSTAGDINPCYIELRMNLDSHLKKNLDLAAAKADFQTNIIRKFRRDIETLGIRVFTDYANKLEELETE